MITADDLPPEARRLLALARRQHTPCGEGSIVWHLWGDADKPPLMLLHGGSGSWLHWVRNIEGLLAEGWQLIVPDLPGFGDSAVPPQGGDADAVVDPLHAGWQQLGRGAACDVIGFSFGAMVGGLWAARHPDAVRSLTLVGAPGLGISRPQRQALRGWRHLETAEARQQAHRHNLGALMLWNPAAIDGLALAVQAANAPRDRMTRRRLAGTDALARALQQTACPVSAIYGEHDVLYEADWDRLVQWFGGFPRTRCFRQVAQAGHWVQYENPTGFLQAWRDSRGELSG